MTQKEDLEQIGKAEKAIYESMRLSPSAKIGDVIKLVEIIYQLPGGLVRTAMIRLLDNGELTLSPDLRLEAGR